DDEECGSGQEQIGFHGSASNDEICWQVFSPAAEDWTCGKLTRSRWYTGVTLWQIAAAERRLARVSFSERAGNRESSHANSAHGLSPRLHSGGLVPARDCGRRP